jgi:hypothetical protein
LEIKEFLGISGTITEFQESEIWKFRNLKSGNSKKKRKFEPSNCEY